MSEIKLQSDIAREFSVRYPKLKGQFFHVSNERNNKVQAFQAKSIGIINGVSDFIYFDKNHLGLKMIGLEVKEPNSYHKVDHIIQQIKWGNVLERCGGLYFIVRSVQEAIEVIEGHYLNALCIEEIEKMLSENGSKKTIKF